MHDFAMGAFVIIGINGWNGSIVDFPMMVAYPFPFLKN
jgi:hypothetical protein